MSGKLATRRARIARAWTTSYSSVSLLPTASGEKHLGPGLEIGTGAATASRSWHPMPTASSPRQACARGRHPGMEHAYSCRPRCLPCPSIRTLRLRDLVPVIGTSAATSTSWPSAACCGGGCRADHATPRCRSRAIRGTCAGKATIALLGSRFAEVKSWRLRQRQGYGLLREQGATWSASHDSTCSTPAPPAAMDAATAYDLLTASTAAVCWSRTRPDALITAEDYARPRGRKLLRPVLHRPKIARDRPAASRNKTCVRDGIRRAVKYFRPAAADYAVRNAVRRAAPQADRSRTMLPTSRLNVMTSTDTATVPPHRAGRWDSR